jgi:LacI family transcriptional regulator
MLITQAHIAKAAGVTQATVSMALRGRPNIPPATQKLVQAVAKKLGYVPDPLLSALSNRAVKDGAKRKSSETIVFLDAWPTLMGWKKSIFLSRMYQGMEEQGKQLGYRVENFWMKERGLSHARASQILYQRGVRGLVIPHQNVARTHFKLDWSKFAIVVYRSALGSPNFNHIDVDHYQKIRLAFHQLRHMGYRRPGLAIDKISDRYSINFYPAGYAVEIQAYHSTQPPIPILTIESYTDGIALRKWIQQYKPDVILGPSYISKLVNLASYRIPQDIGCIALDLETTDGSITGLDSNPEVVGSHAVNMIHVALQTGNYGIPKLVHGVVVDGTWIQGKTTRTQSPPSVTQRPHFSRG